MQFLISTVWVFFTLELLKWGQLGFTENCDEALKVKKIRDDVDKSHFVREILCLPLQGFFCFGLIFFF